MGERLEPAISATFAVKEPTGNYANEEVRLSRTVVFDKTMTNAELAVEQSELMAELKAEVYKAAGVAYDPTDDGLPMRRLLPEVPTSNAGGQTQPAAAPPPPPASHQRNARGAAVNDDKAAQAQAFTFLLDADDQTRKKNFFDNRADILAGNRKPTNPWFKTKTKNYGSEVPLWPNNDPNGGFPDDIQASYELVPDFAWKP